MAKHPKRGDDLKSYEEKQDLATRKEIDDLKATRDIKYREKGGNR